MVHVVVQRDWRVELSRYPWLETKEAGTNCEQVMLALKAVAQLAGMADGTASTLPNSCIEIPPLTKRRRAITLFKT